MNVAGPLRIGVREDMTPPEVRVVVLGNLGALSGAGISAFYGAITAAAGAWTISALMIASVVGFSITLPLNARGLHRLASTGGLATATTVLGVMVVLHGAESGLHFLFLVQATSAFLIYRRTDTWIALAMSLYPASLFTVSVLTGQGHPPPLPITPHASLVVVRTGALLVTCFGLLLTGYYARRIILHADDLAAAEQERSDRLVRDLLPPSVATRLKRGEEVIADAIPDAVVLFADIAGFTTRAHGLRATEVVVALDQVFSRLDTIAARHGVEKIKTVGDAWMGAVGLDGKHPDPVNAAVAAALEMLAVQGNGGRHGARDLPVRIGVHVGPVVAGVIGRSRLSYDLWGDTVNTASRLESQGVPGAVQISREVRERLADRFVVEDRGPIDLRGIGTVSTWLVRPEGNGHG